MGGISEAKVKPAQGEPVVDDSPRELGQPAVGAAKGRIRHPELRYSVQEVEWRE